MSELRSDSELERSEVVANSTMNRERGIAGANSYAKDLHFNPLEFLRGRLSEGREVAWLDLCCGSGRALIEAAGEFTRACDGDRVTIEGIDLIQGFLSYPSEIRCLHFEAASLSVWRPSRTYDLVTCVHGLHYIGDKLGVIHTAVSSLKNDGLFIGHLDLDNVRVSDVDGGDVSARRLLTDAGFEYDTRRRILKRSGKIELTPFWHYLGADDNAGPNSTGQPAVNSHYELVVGNG